jgi:hypothetical protein
MGPRLSYLHHFRLRIPTRPSLLTTSNAWSRDADRVYRRPAPLLQRSPLPAPAQPGHPSRRSDAHARHRCRRVWHDSFPQDLNRVYFPRDACDWLRIIDPHCSVGCRPWPHIGHGRASVLCTQIRTQSVFRFDADRRMEHPVRVNYVHMLPTEKPTIAPILMLSCTASQQGY